MKKIINTFKYADTKTRLVLLLTILSGLGSLAALICAIAFKMMFLFFVMIVCAFLTIALAQTFMISGNVQEQPPMPLPKTALFSPFKKEEETSERPTGSQELGWTLPPMGADAQSETKLKKEKRKKEKKLDRIKYADMKKGKKFSFKRFFKNVAVKLHIKKPEPEPEPAEVREEETPGDINVENWFRHMEGAPEVDEESFRHGGEAQQKAEDTPEAGTENKPAGREKEDDTNKKLLVVRQANEEDFEKYNRKVIKKTLHKYKVKRDHRMVMVDKCEELFIKQSPAYVWVQDKEFHLLLIEKEPRHISLPTFRLREMTYLKKQVVNEDVDYGPFKGKSILAEMFRPYLPDYTHSTVVDDMSAYKNLYGFGPGIYVTNRSAKQIFDLLPIEFRVDDKVTLSAKVNTFFKETYKANILLRDNVLDANGYADRIAKILDNMAHSTISYNEFKETLSLMVRNKLITQEFAGYYMNVRDKASAGK